MPEARRTTARESGFTLIELIVVISIMGILAAIAIPTYTSVQNMMRESATQSDLGSDRTALVAWGIDNNGIVPAATGFAPGSSGLNLVGYGWSQSAETTSYRYVTNAGPTTWCLEMTSSTGTVFRISSNKPVAAGTCAALGAANY